MAAVTNTYKEEMAAATNTRKQRQPQEAVKKLQMADLVADIIYAHLLLPPWG